MDQYKCARRALILVSLLVLAAARPQEVDEEDEYDPSASDKQDDVSRVQIKVFRGPTKNDGYAPWGYWVKQPTDEE